MTSLFGQVGSNRSGELAWWVKLVLADYDNQPGGVSLVLAGQTGSSWSVESAWLVKLVISDQPNTSLAIIDCIGCYKQGV